MTDSSPAPRPTRRGAGTLLFTVSHLALMGVVGNITMALVTVLLGVSIVTLPVFGLGLVFFALLACIAIGAAYFETVRVQTLYGLPRMKMRLAPRSGKGVWATLRWLLRQVISPQFWRPFSSFMLASVFGLLVVVSIPACITLIMQGAMEFDQAGLGVGVLFILGGVAALLLTPLAAYAHTVIAVNLVGRPSRKELTAAAEASSQQREGAVRAASLERTRLERDLHDGVQPRLVSIGMTLGLAQHKIETDPASARELVTEAHTSTKAAITELRQLARGIHASVLADRGLDAALSALAARSHVPVQLDMRLADRALIDNSRYREVEAAAYFIIAEALTNAAKHSHASECQVLGRLHDAGTPEARLWVRVEDNGVGGAEVQPGGGLDGITQRVRAAGGTLRLASPAGGPTTLEVSIPCAS